VPTAAVAIPHDVWYNEAMLECADGFYTVTAGVARCGVAVMGKASISGQTKTRLVPPLSYDEAAQLNTAFLQDICANLAHAGARADVAAYVAYSPAGSKAFFRAQLPASVGLIESCRPNFGACLLHAIEALFACGHESACVLNSDSPTLPTERLVQAAACLREPGDRAVLGLSDDGGFYLLGLKRAHARLFDAIDWSTERTARQVLLRAAELALEVKFLEPWYDIDDAAALRRLCAELALGDSSPPSNAAGYAAPCTRSALTQLLEHGGLAARLIDDAVVQSAAARRVS
jgi:rSAM/selenodomain-associated transferase 1